MPSDQSDASSNKNKATATATEELNLHSETNAIDAAEPEPPGLPEPSGTSGADKQTKEVVIKDKRRNRKLFVISSHQSRAARDGKPALAAQQNVDRCLENGDEATGKNDFERAARGYEDALVMLEELDQDNHSKASECLQNLVNAQLQLEDPDKALLSLRKLCKLDAEVAKSHQTVALLGEVGALYESKGAFDQARTIYLEALSLASDVLPPNDPVAEWLNQAYIDLQRQQSSNSGLSDHIKDTEAQNLLAARKHTTSQLAEIPTPKTIKPTENKSSRPNKFATRFAGAANRAFDRKELREILHAPWFSVVVTVLLLCCCVKFCAVIQSGPRVADKTPVAIPTDFSGMEYTSCDHNVSVKFSPNSECTILNSGQATKASYKLLNRDWLDLRTIFCGYLSRKEFWYQCDANRLLGADRVALYNPNSPELAVVRRMWWYADYAQKCYKESRRYPSDAEKCKEADASFVYNNPITGQADYAAIILQKELNSDIDLTTRGVNDRHWRPGAILCLCSNFQKFLIQGFDSYGRPFPSSDPNRYFAIECKNGAILTKHEPDHSVSPGIDNGASVPTKVFLCENPNIESTVQWLRKFFQILLWTIFSLACLFCYSSHKSKGVRKAKSASIVAVTVSIMLLAIWYMLAWQSIT